MLVCKFLYSFWIAVQFLKYSRENNSFIQTYHQTYHQQTLNLFCVSSVSLNIKTTQKLMKAFIQTIRFLKQTLKKNDPKQQKTERTTIKQIAQHYECLDCLELTTTFRPRTLIQLYCSCSHYIVKISPTTTQKDEFGSCSELQSDIHHCC